MITKLFFACYYQARKIANTLLIVLRKFYFRDIKRHKDLVPRCEPYAKKGYCNLVLINGIGDALIAVALVPALEKRYGPIYFLAQPRYEVLFKMFGIKSYQLLDFLQDFPYSFVPLNKTTHPVVDTLFFAHPFLQVVPSFPEKNGPNFTISIKRLLGLPDDTPLAQPTCWPTLSPRIRTLVDQAGGLEHIVLISPESSKKNSNRRFYWWRKVSRQLHQKGFTVVCNALQPKHRLPDSQDWNLSAEEVIALGLRCRAVISIRSGLCDILSYKGSGLFVLDAHFHLPESKMFFNLNTMFGRTDIHEYFNELAISPEELVEQICATKLQQVPFNFDTIE